MAGRVNGERIVTWVLPLGLAVLVLGPLLLGRGYALVGDMVFVPDQPWKDRWLGLDGSVPRAVPSDAVVWLLGTVVPGDLVQKLVLLGTLTAAGAGAARLTASFSLVARCAAVVLAVWNPYVHERLAIGHWALLVGYAALPWAVLAAVRCREGHQWTALALPLAVAAWSSPTGGVLAVLVVLAVLLGRPRMFAVAAGLGAFVNLPWLLAGLATAPGEPPDPFGVEAFAARADSPWGVLGSLLGLGGIWKESVAAPGRDNWLLSGFSLVLTLLAVAGVVICARRQAARRSTVAALAGVAALGLLLALLPTGGWGQQLVEWLVVEVPGGGLLRDSQKWVALALPALTIGVAAAVDEIGGRFGSRTAAGVAVAAVPLVVLPGLAWGLLGTLAPAPYPGDWAGARAAMEVAGAADGRSVVLPFGLYRRFEWNGGHAVLDPLPRYLPGDVVTDDALAVDTGVVGGEDATAARIRGAADDPDALADVLGEEGIAWVVVHLDDGVVPDGVPRGERVYAGTDLLVLRLPGVATTAPTSTRTWLAGVDGAVVIGTLCAIAHSWRRRGYSRPRENDRGSAEG